MAYNTGKNPFMDVDDDEFLASGSKVSKSGYNDPFRVDNRGAPPPYDDGSGPTLSRYELLQQQKQQSMNRQLESTQRCMATIYDAEQIGIATAEELVHQGEQLDNIERKVDKINADTKVSQRHLNNVKSIFGGIRNWWNGEGKKDEMAAASSTANTTDRSGLRKTIASADHDRDIAATSGTHPGMRLRSDNAAGFYDDDVVEFGGGRVEQSRTYKTQGSSAAPQTQSSSSGRSAEWLAYEKNLNANLEMMSGGITQLKSLAVGLGDEIASQNDQIERIMPKVDRADTKIRDQNRQMRQILGK